MLNFNRISPDADFCSEIKAQIHIVNKNVLYITHMQDKILKILKTIVIDKDLQEQADAAWVDEDHEPSPQTESVNKPLGDREEFEE